MGYQQFAGYGAVCDCVAGSHRRLHHIDELRYIVIAWLDIICVDWTGYESPAECVIYGGDGIKGIRDCCILERKVYAMTVRNFYNGQVVNAVCNIITYDFGCISAIQINLD